MRQKWKLYRSVKYAECHLSTHSTCSTDFTVMSADNVPLRLTKSTAVEFNAHGDEPVPPLRIDPNISCNDWIWQLIRHNIVIIQISFEHL